MVVVVVVGAHNLQFASLIIYLCTLHSCLDVSLFANFPHFFCSLSLYFFMDIIICFFRELAVKYLKRIHDSLER